MNGNRAFILDTEGTGKDPEVDQVIELAWIDAGLTPKGVATGIKFRALYEPTIAISYGAMAVHNILMSDVFGQRKQEDITGDLPPDPDYLIGHNIDYDWRMLKEPDVKRICTLALARNLLPELDDHKQGTLIYYIGHERGQPERARERLREAHSALADVENCAVVLSFLINLARSKGTPLETWSDVWLFSEHARVPSIMTFSKFKGQHVSEVDAGFRAWYRKQTDTDPYVLKAFDLYRFGDNKPC